MIERLVGKYLAIVDDNDDPSGLGRLRVRVPEIYGEETTGWCVPCSPYAGPRVGLAAVPPVGSVVFVEWSGGDTSRTPIWSGGMWPSGSGIDGAGPETVVLVTPGGNRILLRDTGGSEAVEIEAASGATIVLDGDGARIAFGSQTVALTRAAISLNDGALEVT